jgi:hypothetical protein
VLSAAAKGNADDITMTRVAMSWWRDRLKWYEFQPNDKGTLVVDDCDWSDTYHKENIVMCDLAGVEGGSKASWYKGKAMALQAMAEETYGQGHRPIVMKMRSKHSSFKKCDRCSELLDAHTAALKARAPASVLKAAGEAIAAHRA